MYSYSTLDGGSILGAHFQSMMQTFQVNVIVIHKEFYLKLLDNIYLQKVGFDTSDFPILVSLTSWAVSASKIPKEGHDVSDLSDQTQNPSKEEINKEKNTGEK